MAETHGDHGDDHASDVHTMGEEHDGETLGPIDVPAWGAAILGIALGLVVLVAFMQALT